MLPSSGEVWKHGNTGKISQHRLLSVKKLKSIVKNKARDEGPVQFESTLNSDL